MPQIQEKKLQKTKLSRAQVLHLSGNLSRLALNEGELVKTEADLNSIVEYIDQLQNVPSSVTEGLDVDISRGTLSLREDETMFFSAHPEALLSCSPQKVVNGQIVIENIMHA